jgi:hypothetical protein
LGCCWHSKKRGDKLLCNDNGKFVDVSEAAGIYGSLIGFDHVTVGDVNGDLYPDIYISNDFTKRIIYTSIKKWNLYRTNRRMGISH